MKNDIIKDYKGNWETIEKKLLVIATEEKDNLNVQKIIMSTGNDISEGKYTYTYVASYCQLNKSIIH